MKYPRPGPPKKAKMVLDPSAKASPGKDKEPRKRVQRACDRCRFKKGRCNGEQPCDKCKLEEEEKGETGMCMYGEKVRIRDIVYSKGVVEELKVHLEKAYIVIRGLYNLAQEHEIFPGGPVETLKNKQPSIHAIAFRMGAVKPQIRPAEIHEENLDESIDDMHIRLETSKRSTELDAREAALVQRERSVQERMKWLPRIPDTPNSTESHRSSTLPSPKEHFSSQQRHMSEQSVPQSQIEIFLQQQRSPKEMSPEPMFPPSRQMSPRQMFPPSEKMSPPQLSPQQIISQGMPSQQIFSQDMPPQHLGVTTGSFATLDQSSNYRHQNGSAEELQGLVQSQHAFYSMPATTMVRLDTPVPDLYQQTLLTNMHGPASLAMNQALPSYSRKRSRLQSQNEQGLGLHLMPQNQQPQFLVPSYQDHNIYNHAGAMDGADTTWPGDDHQDHTTTEYLNSNMSQSNPYMGAE